jgi:hypothetical protein
METSGPAPTPQTIEPTQQPGIPVQPQIPEPPVTQPRPPISQPPSVSTNAEGNKKLNKSVLLKAFIIFIVVAFIISLGVLVVKIRNDVQTTTNSIKTAQNNAKDQQIKADIEKLRAALEIYRADNGGNYPASLSNLTTKYIGTLPISPYNSDDYAYTVTGSTYTLSATLGDGTMYSQKSP